MGKNMKEVRRFGFHLGLALNIAGSIMFYRERAHFIFFTGVGSLSLIFAILYPMALRPLKKILDFIILSIGRIINTVSLMIVFYLIFAPIGIFLRILGRDLLHERIDKRAVSYWVRRRDEPPSEKSYERMG